MSDRNPHVRKRIIINNLRDHIKRSSRSYRLICDIMEYFIREELREEHSRFYDETLLELEKELHHLGKNIKRDAEELKGILKIRRFPSDGGGQAGQ